MSARDFDGIFYVRKAPSIKLENGMFHVCHMVGRSQFEFVMRPSIFLASLSEANEVAAKWQVNDLDKVKSLR